MRLRYQCLAGKALTRFGTKVPQCKRGQWLRRLVELPRGAGRFVFWNNADRAPRGGNGDILYIASNERRQT
jgi:hypothetical protein